MFKPAFEAKQESIQNLRKIQNQNIDSDRLAVLVIISDAVAKGSCSCYYRFDDVSRDVVEQELLKAGYAMTRSRHGEYHISWSHAKPIPSENVIE